MKTTRKLSLLVTSMLLLGSSLQAEGFLNSKFSLGTNVIDSSNISDSNHLSAGISLAGYSNQFLGNPDLFLGLIAKGLRYEGHSDYDKGSEFQITPALKYCTGPLSFTGYLGYDKGKFTPTSSHSQNYSGLVYGIEGDILVWKKPNSLNSSTLGMGYEIVNSTFEDNDQDFDIGRFTINIGYKF